MGNELGCRRWRCLAQTSPYYGPGFQYCTVSSNLIDSIDLNIIPPRYQAVWTETVNVYREMTEAEGWAGEKVIEVSDVSRLTHKVKISTLTEIRHANLCSAWFACDRQMWIWIQFLLG